MNAFYWTRHLRGLAGYVLDVASVAAFNDKNPRGLVKFGILARTRALSGARTLIETGTFEGVTTHRASFIFDKVISIELDDKLSAVASSRLASRKNVEIIRGDGTKLLPVVLERDDVQDVLVFLDGHYSGGVTAAGDVLEPVVHELEALARFKHKLRAIVIDDFRTFDGSPGFPRKSEVFAAIERLFPAPDFRCNVFFDQVLLYASAASA